MRWQTVWATMTRSLMRLISRRPDVILSVIATPGQEGFLKENKEKFNAKIWYGLGAGYAAKRGVSEVAGFARKMLHKGMMLSMLLRYKKNEE